MTPRAGSRFGSGPGHALGVDRRTPRRIRPRANARNSRHPGVPHGALRCSLRRLRANAACPIDTHVVGRPAGRNRQADSNGHLSSGGSPPVRSGRVRPREARSEPFVRNGTFGIAPRSCGFPWRDSRSGAEASVRSRHRNPPSSLASFRDLLSLASQGQEQAAAVPVVRRPRGDGDAPRHCRDARGGTRANRVGRNLGRDAGRPLPRRQRRHAPRPHRRALRAHRRHSLTVARVPCRRGGLRLSFGTAMTHRRISLPSRRRGANPRPDVARAGACVPPPAFDGGAP